MLSFVNYGLLAGTSLVAIPIIIYLFQKHRVVEMEWAAMRFLMEIVEEQKKKIVLEDLLLLLLRVLMILFLALALARPILESEIAGDILGESADALFMVDNSYSMETRDGAATRADKARERSQEILQKLPFGFGASLVLASEEPEALISTYSTDRELVMETVKGLKSGDLMSDAEKSIYSAAKILASGHHAEKMLFLLSDFQQSQWSDPEPTLLKKLKKMSEDAKIFFLPMGDDREKNLSVSELTLPKGVVKVDQETLFRATIHNHGSELAKNVSVDLLVDGRVCESKTANVPPGQSTGVFFYISISEAGPHRAEVKIGEDDLKLDNRRFLTFNVREKIQILAVSDHLPKKDEPGDLSFVELVLNPYTERSKSPLALYEFKHVSMNAFEYEQLDSYSLVLLANVPLLTSHDASKLEEYVRNGGGVMIFMGKDVNVEVWNQNLYREGEGLLHWPLMEKSLKPEDENAALEFVGTHSEHPIWKRLLAEKGNYMQGVRFYQSHAFEKVVRKGAVKSVEKNPKEGFESSVGGEDPLSANTAPSSAALKKEGALAMGEVKIPGQEKSAPMMVDFHYGRGHALVMGSSADLSWNNFALRPAYVAFIHKAVAYLRSFRQGSFNVRAGGSLEHWVDFNHSQSDYLMVSPSKESETISVLEENGEYRLNTGDLHEAGFYSLVNIDDEKDKQSCAVNVDPREGNIRSMTAEDLTRVYGEHGVKVLSGGDLSEALGELKASPDFALPLLILAFLCWVAENLLAYRISKR